MISWDEIAPRLAEAQKRVVFREKGHTYHVDGERFLSVTNIIGMLDKPWMGPWAANEQQAADLAAIEGWLESGQSGDLGTLLDRVKHAHWRKSKKARDLGKEAHSVIEHELREQLQPTGAPAPQVSSDALYVVSAWKRWAAGVGLKPLAVETNVYSLRYKVAGRFDAIIGQAGSSRPILSDWKSAKAIYDDHEIQANAYRGIFAEMVGIDPEAIDCVIVRLPKDNPEPPEVRAVPWDPAGYEAFLGLLPMARWRKGR